MTELATTVGVALLFTLLAMWATGPAASCTLAPEPHQRLDLDRLVDREHLATDVREIARVARRYAARTAPPDGIDATIAMKRHDVRWDDAVRGFWSGRRA
jgi:hypothetical protein